MVDDDIARRTDQHSFPICLLAPRFVILSGNSVLLLSFLLTVLTLQTLVHQVVNQTCTRYCLARPRWTL